MTGPSIETHRIPSKIRRAAVTLAAGCAVVLLGAACHSDGAVDGTWHYDTDRLAELAAVSDASAAPRGTLGGTVADDSERAEVLRVLRREAANTTVTIDDARIVVARTGEPDQVIPYIVRSRSGNTWTVKVTQRGNRELSLRLDGDRLTIEDAAGRVRFVLRR